MSNSKNLHTIYTIFTMVICVPYCHNLAHSFVLGNGSGGGSSLEPSVVLEDQSIQKCHGNSLQRQHDKGNQLSSSIKGQFVLAKLGILVSGQLIQE